MKSFVPVCSENCTVKAILFALVLLKINIKKERKLMTLILSSLPNDILEPSYHVIMKLIVISKCNKR